VNAGICQTVPVTSAIDALEARLGANWKAIRAARVKTDEVVGNLGTALADLYDTTFSVVVTGREGVTRPFFDVHPKLSDLIRKFGVF
jgi:hypothetical protein